MAYNLPGGRGTLEGQNAENLYGEQLRSRNKEIAPRDGWYISQVAPWAVFDSVTLGSDKLASPTFLNGVEKV